MPVDKSSSGFVKPVLVFLGFVLLAYALLAGMGMIDSFLGVGRTGLLFYVVGCVVIFLVFMSRRYRRPDAARETESKENNVEEEPSPEGNATTESLEDVRARIRARKGSRKGRD